MENPSEQSSPPLLRPLPRRPFQTRSASSNVSSNEPSHSPTPHIDPRLEHSEPDTKGDISKSRSIVNLTSSTLFGIYAPSSFNENSAPQTPWGTGAETPLRNSSVDGFPSSRGGPPRGQELEDRLLRGTSGNDSDKRPRRTGSPKPSAQQHHVPKPLASVLLRGGLRVVLLFCFGLAYGGIIAHLHDNRNVAPVKVEGLNHASWRYLAFWGFAGVAMGSLLPWVDEIWGSVSNNTRDRSPARVSRRRGLNSVEWNDVVRSVGAFAGVAFAIRKLPWSSPLQLSLSLALVNPFLWYLLDRTTAGFTLSTAIGVLGTTILLAINPTLIPAPTDKYSSSNNHTTPPRFVQHSFGDKGVIGIERVGVATWIVSVLFCSCVCFGNIGRLLVPATER